MQNPRKPEEIPSPEPEIPDKPKEPGLPDTEPDVEPEKPDTEPEIEPDIYPDEDPGTGEIPPEIIIPGR
jgi:hypothetical protein